jgi:antitoxin YobK
MFEEVERILRENGELADVGLPQGEEAIAAAERALAVLLPASYREYLRRWGWMYFGPTGYLGLGTDVGDVVKLTLNARRDLGLPRALVVVSDHDGDEYVCLDTATMEDHECPVVVWDAAARMFSRPRAKNFETFLESDLRAFLD